MDKLFNFKFSQLTSREQIVTVLAFLTGLLHLIYGLTDLRYAGGMLDYMFIANFAGNIVLITMLYFMPILDPYQNQINWVFILYTLSSIVAYFIVYYPLGLNALLIPSGLFDKLLETFLLIFLIMDRPLEDPTKYRSEHSVAN